MGAKTLVTFAFTSFGDGFDEETISDGRTVFFRNMFSDGRDRARFPIPASRAPPNRQRSKPRR